MGFFKRFTTIIYTDIYNASGMLDEASQTDAYSWGMVVVMVSTVNVGDTR